MLRPMWHVPSCCYVVAPGACGSYGIVCCRLDRLQEVKLHTGLNWQERTASNGRCHKEAETVCTSGRDGALWGHTLICWQAVHLIVTAICGARGISSSETSSLHRVWPEPPVNELPHGLPEAKRSRHSQKSPAGRMAG